MECMVNGGSNTKETDGNKLHFYHKDQLVDATDDPPSKENPVAEIEFVNHAEIAWNEARKRWVGDSSHRPKITPEEHIMSWSLTYEDLLSTHEPFQQPIPLAEMVDFLVDIWFEDALYDYH
ncbi:hypothetical protein LINPERHAP1_LOCUS13482 [Linum perenne]